MFTNLLTLAQSDTGSAAGGVVLILYLALIIIMIAGLWKTFAKAGQPGWGVLIPLYNLYLMVKIAGRPGWWFILMLIPFVNIVISIILAVDIARCFGKGVGFALGLVFLPFIFYPVLGFGAAEYNPMPTPAFA